MAVKPSLILSRVGAFLSISLILQITGEVYKEFREFEPGQILSYGILDIGNNSDWLPALQRSRTGPKFKYFFLELLTIDDLVSFLKNYNTLSPDGNVIPYYERSYELFRKPSHVHTLQEAIREARNKSPRNLPFKNFPLFVGIDAILSDHNITTTFRALQILDIPLGMYITSNSENFQQTIPAQLTLFAENNFTVTHLMFIRNLWFPTCEYDGYEVFLNYFLRDMKQRYAGNQVEIIICLGNKDEGELQEPKSMIIKFFYHWGENAKVKVMAQHWSGITDFTEIDSYVEALFKHFSPDKTPLVGTTEYSRLGLLQEICRRARKVPNMSEIVVEYKMERQLTKILEFVENFDCETEISLQFNYYKGPNFDFSRLHVVVSSIAQAIENHATKLKRIIVSLCGRNCVCPQKGTDKKKLNRVIQRLNRQNVSVELEACGDWLVSNVNFVKTVGITGLTYKPNYDETFLESKIGSFSVALSLLERAGKISEAYVSWMNSKNIYLDTSFEYYGLPQETCRLWKSIWNLLLNLATIHRFSVVAPLTSLLRFDFGHAMMANKTNHDLQYEFSARNIGQCSHLPVFGKEAFQFNKSLTAVTFHNEANRFSAINPENLAVLFEFIYQSFNTIEVVITDRISTDIGQKSIRSIIQSLEYLQDFAVIPDVTDKFRFFLNLGNQRLFPKDACILKQNVAAKVRGAHINFNPETAKIEEKQDTLNMLKQCVDFVGIVIDYEHAIFLTENEQENELIPSCKYVIIHVNILNVISSQYGVLPAQVIQDFGEGKLNPDSFHNIFINLRVWKLSFSEMYPDVKFYARFAWPTANDRLSTHTFLSVWKFIHAFSTTYQFPIFVYQAFDDSEQSDLGYGWWKPQNKNKSITDLDNYVAKQADYLGLETKRPKTRIIRRHSEKSSTLTNGIIVGMTITGFVLLGLTAAGFVRIQMLKRKRILTKQEKQEFEMGVQSTEENNDNDDHVYGVRYDKEQYELRRRDFVRGSATEIGRGQFGIVYKCYMARFKSTVAVKLPNAKEKTQLMSILREIKLMAYLGEHINVVKLLGAYTAEIQSGYVFVVTEYLENGSLLEYLRELKKTVGEFTHELQEKLCGFCEDISEGMGYLAEKNVIHGDLAARNVLLDGNYVCKITDFGLSKQLYAYTIYVQTTPKPLPWAWLAVETLEQREFTTKSDVWSMGVTFWEIFTLGKQPYSGLRWDMEFTRKLREGLRLPKPEFISDEIYAEILKCWTIEPEERPLPGFFANFFERQKQDAFYSDI